MAANASQPITVHLPPDILRQINAAAKRRHVTPDRVIAETLGSLLPVERDDSARDVRTRTHQMLEEPREELVRRSNMRLPDESAVRLSALLAANGERKLSTSEERELDRLLEESERIALDSLAARWALKSLERSDG